MRPMLVAGFLLTSLLAVAPTGVAHDCQAENPRVSCGECAYGTHDHRYSDATVYCESYDPSILCLDPISTCLP
jgi:hypothetical protein